MSFLVKICSIPAALLSKVPGIGPVVKTCCTTVGQKLLMALTGLALVGFLITHLAGNLLLYAGEEKFNEYAEQLHSLGPILWAAEVVLLSLFLAHIGLAVSTAALSATARKKKYAEKVSKQDNTILMGGGAGNYMFPTGVMVLIFLILHVADMKFNVRDSLGLADFEHGEENLFAHVQDVLKDPIAIAVYILGLAALGIHLSHGIASAFQTLGINHSRWNGLIRSLCLLLGWALVLGFGSLVIWGIFGPAPVVAS